MSQTPKNEFNARQWFVVFEAAVNWAREDLRSGLRDTVERRSRYAILSRNTSPRFARAVAALGATLAKGADAARDAKERRGDAP